MLSTVASRLALIAALASPFCSPNLSYAAQSESEAKVVAKLYQDYAWQAIATQSRLFGEGVAGAGRTRLERYFAPKLTQLLIADWACQEATHEMCNLDFDILFDSQDPRVADLDVALLAPGRVQVQFNDPVTDKKTLIEFKLAMVERRWRIDDIVYQKHPQQSLKTVLSRQLPGRRK
jgi:hypothetical protein